MRSPFIGGFIITWSIKHWKLYYLLFSSEQGLKIDSRIKNVNNYLIGESYFSLFFEPILYTLLVLIFYSFLNSLGLIIKLATDNYLTPFIHKKIQGTTVLKIDFDRVKRDLRECKEEKDSKIENYLSSETNLKASNSKVIDLQSQLESLRKECVIPVNKNPNNLFLDNQWVYKSISSKGEKIEYRIEKSLSNKNKSVYLIEGSNSIIDITNVKEIEGRYLYFDKNIGGKKIKVSLVKMKKGLYKGVEIEVDEPLEFCIVEYIHNKNEYGLVIKDATYIAKENHLLNVTNHLKDLVNNNIFKFNVSNETFGKDPYFGIKKRLMITVNISNLDDDIKLDFEEGEDVDLNKTILNYIDNKPLKNKIDL